jgi:hypothetical protein
MQLISHNKFTNLLNGENNGLGTVSPKNAENPMGYSAAGGDRVLHERTACLVPEEVRDEKGVELLLESNGDGRKEGKVGAVSPYRSLGRPEPDKLDYSKDTLTVQSHFLRWSRDKAGRYEEFSIRDFDGKAIARSALALLARAMREKNQAPAFGFFNAIPNGLQFGKGEEDNAIRKISANII